MMKQPSILRPIHKFFTRRCTRSNQHRHTHNSINTDTLIIGGGPIGLSVAYHLSILRNNNGSDITIIERDPTYARASAVLSAGGIRQQFSLKQNVEMSLYGRDFLRNASELLKVDNQDSEEEEEVDVQFQEHGYLFLAATNEGKEQLIQNNQVQTSVGADIQLLSPAQLKDKFPWLNTDDILLGSFGNSGEGWFDPWSLLRGLKRKCKSLGVNFVKGSPVQSVRDEQSGSILAVDVMHHNEQNINRYNVSNVVNAAGAHCQELMNILAGFWSLQYPIPVEPRKRSIFFFHCKSNQSPEDIPNVAPLTVCPKTNVYFRSEGVVSLEGEPTGNFLCGVSPSEEVDRAIQDISEIDYADHELFDEVIWPALYHRVPAFGELKLKSSWAGLYEYNIIDQNGE
jgi:FAD-dependent oxidoreductase domain-containing protein 1